MNYPYLKDNSFKYTLLSTPCLIVATENEIKPLPFLTNDDGSLKQGTYYLYSNNRLISFANEKQEISQTYNNPVDEILYQSSNCVNLKYFLQVNIYNPDVVTTSNVTCILKVNENEYTKIIYNTINTIVTYEGQIPNLSNSTITLTCNNAQVTVTGNFINDLLVPNSSS